MRTLLGSVQSNNSNKLSPYDQYIKDQEKANNKRPYDDPYGLLQGSKKPVSTTPSGGQSSGGGGSYNNSNAIYEAFLAQQQALQEEQRRARAASRDSSISSANSAYNQGLGAVNKTVDGALQQAYINRKMSERDLPQNLSAMGLTGGMSESTAAGMQNQYGNSRNQLETQRAQNVSDLQHNLQNNIASAEQAYQGGLMSDISNDINYQRSALEGNLSRAYANNKSSAVSVEQGGGGKDLTKVGAYGRIKAIFDSTGNVDEAIRGGGAMGLTSEEIQNFLNAYYGR